jgi:soluble lytic murein transglycosylase-like protein
LTDLRSIVAAVALCLGTVPALAQDAPAQPTSPAAASAGPPAPALAVSAAPVAPAAPPATVAPSLTTLPASPPGGRKLYLPVIEREAKARGLPVEIADAVARVESGYEPSAVGAAGERGLMQVMPPTAAMLGFKGGAAELADPETNIRYGVEYLAGAWKLANGDLCRALMKYRAGHNEERMSPLSVEYCRRARSHLASIGSPLGEGALPTPNFFPGGATAGVSAMPRVRVAGRRPHAAPGRTAPPARLAVNQRLWTDHLSRIRAIEARLPWKRGGIMAPG